MALSKLWITACVSSAVSIFCKDDHIDAFHQLRLISQIERPSDIEDKFAAQTHTYHDLQVRQKELQDVICGLQENKNKAQVQATQQC